VVSIDHTGRAAGRGAYVCRDAVCLDRAIRTGALGRALGTRLPDDVRASLNETFITDQSAHMTTPNTEGGARGQE
jgi:predicted RNA-binding protein YlxR (DUF448 family)